MKLYVPLNCQQLELQRPRIGNLASDPASPLEGETYYNATTKKLRVWNGTGWDELGAAGAASDATTTTKGVVQLAGDLTGTAAAPTVATGAITDTKVATANKDGLAGTASMRTLGTGAQQAMAGSTRLDTIAAPTASVSLNSQKIISLLDPTAAQDAATKAYVDNVAAGLDVKPSVRVATTAAGTLTSSFANGQTVDGVVLATGDRILVKNQAAGAENGIYVVSASGAPTRATDFDAANEIPGGHVFVEQGTTNADTGWVCTNDAGATIGSTAIVFTQFTGAASFVDGNGLTRTGNQVDVNVDNSSIEINTDILRVKALGVTNAMLAGSIDVTTKITGAVPVANGGTGQTTAKAARETGLVAVGYYSSATHAAGTTITITQATHGWRASRGLVVQVQEESTGAVVLADIVVGATGDVTVTFANSQTANTMRITILG